MQVYSGEFTPDTNYKKFDIVEAQNVGGVFYYARQDIIDGGGSDIVGTNRFIFNKDDDSITDIEVPGKFATQGFKDGQIIKVKGSSANDGEMTLLTVTGDGIGITVDATLKDETDIDSNGTSTNDITIAAVDQTPGESSNQLWSQL